MAAIKILSAQIQAFIALNCGQVSGGFVQLKLGCWLLSVKKTYKVKFLKFDASTNSNFCSTNWHKCSTKR